MLLFDDLFNICTLKFSKNILVIIVFKKIVKMFRHKSFLSSQIFSFICLSNLLWVRHTILAIRNSWKHQWSNFRFKNLKLCMSGVSPCQDFKKNRENVSSQNVSFICLSNLLRIIPTYKYTSLEKFKIWKIANLISFCHGFKIKIWRNLLSLGLEWSLLQVNWLNS